MIKLFIALFFQFIILKVDCQNFLRPKELPLPSVLFKSFHGLINSRGQHFLEGEGYFVIVEKLDSKATEENINKVLKRYLPKKTILFEKVAQRKLIKHNLLPSEEVREFTDTFFKSPNRNIQIIETYDSLKIVRTAYIIPDCDGNILHIAFIKHNKIDRRGY